MVFAYGLDWSVLLLRLTEAISMGERERKMSFLWAQLEEESWDDSNHIEYNLQQLLLDY